MEGRLRATAKAPAHRDGGRGIMSSSSVDTLVRMGNQIPDFFKIQPANQAVEGTADHIRRFWDPRMRAMMAEHLTHGGAGLNPIALKAAQQVCKPAAGATAAGHS